MLMFGPSGAISIRESHSVGVTADPTVDVTASARFDFLSAEYRALFARAHATMFQAPSWLSCVYSELAPAAAATPLIVTVRANDPQRLIAVLPLLVRSHLGLKVAEFADLGVCDYCAAIVDPAFADILASPAVVASVRKQLRACSLVIARKVPQRALTTFDLLGKVRRSALPVHSQFLDPGGSLKAWRRLTNGHCRGNRLDHKRRKLARKGHLETRVLTDPNEIAGVVDRVRALRHERFEERGMENLLGDSTYAAFYRRVAHMGPTSRGYMLYLDDHVLAAAFGVTVDKVFHLLLIGFDPTSFRNGSAGLLLIEDIVLDGIQRGERGVDMTIGDQPYKTQFGAVASDVFTVTAGLGLLGRTVASILARFDWVRPAVRALGLGKSRL